MVLMHLKSLHQYHQGVIYFLKCDVWTWQHMKKWSHNKWQSHPMVDEIDSRYLWFAEWKSQKDSCIHDNISDSINKTFYIAITRSVAHHLLTWFHNVLKLILCQLIILMLSILTNKYHVLWKQQSAVFLPQIPF